MNRPKDFWAPRRHGFDDDGPVGYDQRPRAPRAASRSDAPFDEPAFAPLGEPSADAVDAVVKWFKDEKGFGFVELSDGQGDAFLHATVLHSSGFDTVMPGT